MKTDIEKVPENSDITIEQIGDELTIILPYRKSNGNDMFCKGINVVLFFMALIFGGSAISIIKSSSYISNYEWFWLILFMLMPFLGLWSLYITLRQTTHGKIVLKPKELFFDSGISPYYCAEKQDALTPRYSHISRQQRTFSIQELKSLVLTKTKDDLLYFLTFEKSKKPIFLGYRMRNDEKKWLYRIILKYYESEGSYRVMKIDESRPKEKILLILAGAVIFVSILNMIK